MDFLAIIGVVAVGLGLYAGFGWLISKVWTERPDDWHTYL